MVTSLAPSCAASLGLFVCFSLLTIASRTTMEFVTRIPTDMPMAISVEVLSVNPTNCIKNMPMMMVRGMVITTTSMERML